MRAAALLGAVEGALGVGFGIFILVLSLTGLVEETVDFVAWRGAWMGPGTALVFFAFFGPVLAAGILLLTGKTWGRTIIIFLNFILLGCAWFAFTTHVYSVGVVFLIVGLTALGLCFHPRSNEWAVATFR